MAKPAPDRDPFELLAAEFIDLCRAGRYPSVDEYANKHPELASEIRDLFPTIAAIEQVKSAGSGQPSGGPVRGGLTLERLGDFRIIRELGRGGMGIVYEAEQESLGRRVALKVLPRPLLFGQEQAERFQCEARLSAKLHHTNIVPIFGVGQHSGYHFIVMQYIRGVGLDAVLRKLQRLLSGGGVDARQASSGPSSSWNVGSIDAFSVAHSLATMTTAPGGDFSSPSCSSADHSTANPPSPDGGTPTASLGHVYWRSAARVVLQAAEALDYAHRQGILHRDIKPSNLLIDEDATVWVADFGLAKAVDQQGVTHTGHIVGTLRYMAPEQFKGRYDVRSEVYSLGLTLYETVTLCPAFAETGKTTLIDAIAHGQPTAPRRLCPSLPRDLETVILKSTAPDPDRRYVSAGAFAEDLRCFLEDRPIQARRATAGERLWRWSRRNPALAALTGLVAALLVVVAVSSTAAYLHTNRANLRVREALAGEQAQRRKAEVTTDLALEAIDTIFAEFVPPRTASIAADYAKNSDGQAVTIPLQPVLSKETAAILEHMLEFYVRLAKQEGDAPAIRRKMADANRRVGDIYQRLGNFTDAETAYSQALVLYEDLSEDATGSLSVNVEIARIHNELGSMFVAQERGEEGHAQFLQAASALEAASGSGQRSSEYLFEMARSCFLLGRIPRPPVPHGQLPAEPPPGMSAPSLHRRGEYLRRAISILRELQAAYPNTPCYRHLLALCYRESGSDEAFPFFEPASDPRAQAVDVLEQLVRDFPDVPEYRYELGETYSTLNEGDGLTAFDSSGGEQHMQAALHIMEALVAERPNVPLYRFSLARMHHKMGNELLWAGRQWEARESFRQAIALQSTLVHRSPDVASYAVAQVVYQLSLAELLFEQERLSEARELLESSVEILDSEGCQALRHGYVYDLSERGCRLLSEVLRCLGEDSLATEATERAIISQQMWRDWHATAVDEQLHPR